MPVQYGFGSREGNIEYKVERVIGYRELNRRRQFLLKYAGFSENCSTYEDHRKLRNIRKMLVRYLDAQGRPYVPLHFPRQHRNDEEEAEENEQSDAYKNMCYDVEIIMYLQAIRKSLRLDSPIKFIQYPGKEKADQDSDI